MNINDRKFFRIDYINEYGFKQVAVAIDNCVEGYKKRVPLEGGKIVKIAEIAVKDIFAQ